VTACCPLLVAAAQADTKSVVIANAAVPDGGDTDDEVLLGRNSINLNRFDSGPSQGTLQDRRKKKTIKESLRRRHTYTMEGGSDSTTKKTCHAYMMEMQGIWSQTRQAV
jgi:hypothetical protein